MRWGNRFGTPVDPVPFLVVAAFGFLFCYTFGPSYLMAFGAELAGGLGYSTMAFLAVTGLAYYRFVWTARPELRNEIPAQFRLRRIVLGGLVVAGVFALLSLPLLHAVV
ncbi:hypothetical protein [Halorussus sp. MSC15.2]|uniref:hypothetical protein n=1 Tax=Halorussus sp. MSC15.2 TaxID=2283638 RepID=UPI0013D4FEE3|nr:hypothetical protein [Halorussus sp. MSC15.2]NEU55238.1 hypothetical protein [Halorussus sp. MSC15.2]